MLKIIEVILVTSLWHQKKSNRLSIPDKVLETRPCEPHPDFRGSEELTQNARPTPGRIFACTFRLAGPLANMLLCESEYQAASPYGNGCTRVSRPLDGLDLSQKLRTVESYTGDLDI